MRKTNIQEKTGAKIAISSMHDVSPYNLDRTISISGSLKEIADAEQLITEKLRQFEVLFYDFSRVLSFID